MLYRRLPRLFDELELAHGDGRFPRLFRSLTKTQLLILVNRHAKLTHLYQRDQNPWLDKALFQQMLTGRWIKHKRNLMITGPCGVGKTWLACALA